MTVLFRRGSSLSRLYDVVGGFMSLLHALPLLVWFVLLSSPVFATSDFAGSDSCSECHAEIYSSWHATGHHQMLRKANKADHSKLPLPQGYSWKDISYVIGGHEKKALFVDLKGYLITAAKNGSNAPAMYDIDKGLWRNYLPGKKKSYDCAFCHTTGYRVDGHQDGRPGIVGTWEEDGIGCEACHGPGRAHINHPQKRMVQAENAAKQCEVCHQRGGISQRPLTDVGLTQHHEQLNELKSGAHKGLSCTNCHSPHKSGAQAKRNCTICHSRLYSSFLENPHAKSGVTCIDCHMAGVEKTAISRVRYIGESRTHLFKVNPDPEAEMFEIVEEKGQKSVFAKGFLTVDYVCLGCHGSHDKAWAAQNAKGFHD
jgi:hypothetical protein